MVRAKKITDNMAIRAAYSLAEFAENRGIDVDNIVPAMDESDVFPKESVDVALQAIDDGVARNILSKEELMNIAKQDIQVAQKMTQKLMDDGFIEKPSEEMLRNILSKSIDEVLEK